LKRIKSRVPKWIISVIASSLLIFPSVIQQFWRSFPNQSKYPISCCFLQFAHALFFGFEKVKNYASFTRFSLSALFFHSFLKSINHHRKKEGALAPFFDRIQYLPICHLLRQRSNFNLKQILYQNQEF
jgi:hypothetical protein